MLDYKNQIVWIIGASSGIGRALAQELSARGAILILSARRKDELDTLNSSLGDVHKVYPLDVTNADMVSHTAQEIYLAMGRIDRIIFMAAAYTLMKTDALDMTLTHQMIDVNIKGAFHVVQAAIPILISQQKRGQLALCGSVAGYVGLPNGQPYSATKAAIINLTESLYAEHNKDIDIKLITPGFVQTPLTDKNDFDMPMIISSQDAAKEIADGLLSKKFEIHFPKKFTIFLKFLRLLPYSLSLFLTSKIKR